MCVTETAIRAEYADLFDGVGLLEGDLHLDIDKTVSSVQIISSENIVCSCFARFATSQLNALLRATANRPTL